MNDMRHDEDATGDHTLELSYRAARGPWHLEIGSREGSRSIVLEPGERVVLGSGRNAELRISDRTVSARHCLVYAEGAGVTVKDLGSTNGLFVGAARVSDAALSAGGSFVMGRTTVVVRPDHESVSECAEPLPGVVGDSAPMRRVARDVRRHAGTRAPVLLLGESGTGKDVIARALHAVGRRAGPYVPLNVGALSESLADAELFGHRRGAFTGALAARAGAFEQAHRGTLFLDEIAELSPALQVKLLRVVEDGSVRPLGASAPVRVDVRVVSATWAPLEQRVAEDRFRSDLYHRLSVVIISLPPLRERKSDLPALAGALLGQMAGEVGEKLLSSAALAALVAHSWPGNVRELKSALYRAAVCSDGREIDAGHVDIRRRSGSAAPGATNFSPDDAPALLERHRGNVSAAARAARVPRSTFRAWLDKARRGSRG
jgi:DNA-binding NtrC family response regulator